MTPDPVRSLAALALSVLLVAPAWAQGPDVPERPFEFFAPEDVPDIDFRDLSASDRAYLGVTATAYTLRKLPADVVVLEFMNVHCPACKQQAAFLNQLHGYLQNRPDRRDRVKLVSVAAGNTAAEVAAYRKEYSVDFPVIADTKFKIYDLVGSAEGLPFLLMVTVHPPGGGEIAAMGHLGIINDLDRLKARVETALTSKGLDPTTRTARIKRGEWRNLKYNASESYVKKQLVAVARGAGLRDVTVERVELAEDDVVYRLRAPDGRRVWGKVAGRARICNICHNVFFIILFDDQGKVVNFHPLSVTKGYNLKWDKEDISFTRERLVGRSVLAPADFDPEVDAVSSATMTSDLIFDTVRRLGETHKALKARGLLK